MGSLELSSVQSTSASAQLVQQLSMMKLLLVTIMVIVAVAQARSNGFTCHDVGAFPDKDCTGFHVCEMNGSGFSESWYPCPSGTLYDVVHKKCIAGGICPTAVNKPLEI